MLRLACPDGGTNRQADNDISNTQVLTGRHLGMPGPIFQILLVRCTPYPTRNRPPRTLDLNRGPSKEAQRRGRIVPAHSRSWQDHDGRLDRLVSGARFPEWVP